MAGTPQLSVVVPVHDEAGNIAPLVREVVAALRDVEPFELVYVDDASRDATLDELRALKAEVPELRVLRHPARAGQSAAIRISPVRARETKPVRSRQLVERPNTTPLAAWIPA